MNPMMSLQEFKNNWPQCKHKIALIEVEIEGKLGYRTCRLVRLFTEKEEAELPFLEVRPIEMNGESPALLDRTEAYYFCPKKICAEKIQFSFRILFNSFKDLKDRVKEIEGKLEEETPRQQRVAKIQKIVRNENIHLLKEADPTPSCVIQ